MNARPTLASRRRFRAAFSLVEVLVAMGIIGVLFVALYAGFLSGFRVLHLARENLRATQVMLEKMETLRLYSWQQLNTSGFIPGSFTARYDPTATNNAAMTYYGTISISNYSSIYGSVSYASNIRVVTVQVVWTNSGLRRTRVMSTLVSRNGLQNYIY